ncbi:hypothetical protein ACN6LC_007047 [Streptomyces violaceoruber]|uniref:hypothetical protein n=1 Tax=Streptomyces violaceoruber group TaxID=2867121 RepID=UPI00364D267E
MSFVPVVSQKLSVIFEEVAAAGTVCDRSSAVLVRQQAVHVSAEAAADSGAPTAWLLGPVVTVVVAVVGWLLYAWYRRRDHRRANLTETSETLGKVDLEVRRLTALHCALTAADFTALGDLLLHVQRAAARCGQGRRLKPLQVKLACVADAITQYTGLASVSDTAVAQAHVDATVITDVPAALEIAVFVRAIQKQVRAAEHLATAVLTAEDRLEKLRAT